MSAKAQWIRPLPVTSDPGDLPVIKASRGGLLGPVKSLRIETAEVTHEGAKPKEQARRLSSTALFDPKGNITEWAQYFDGHLSFKKRYAYDAAGTVRMVLTEDADGAEEGREVYGHDRNGRITESSECRKDTPVGGVPGPPGTATLPAPRPARICENYRYAYDSSGLVSERASIGADGRAFRTTVYDYDAEGRLIKTTLVQYIGYQRTTFAYDVNGNLIEMAHFPLTDLGERNNKPYRSYVFSYNGAGRPISSSIYERDSLKSKWAYSYEVDRAGNWTKYLMSEWKTIANQSHLEPVRVTYRTITYY